MKDLKAIGGRIRIIRKQLGLFQDELAKKLKVSTPTISDVENGKSRIGFDVLYRLSTFFNVNLEYVLHGEGDIFKPKETGIEFFWKEKPFGDLTDEVKEMFWFMQKSRFFVGLMTTYSKDYLYKNESILERDILLAELGSSLKREMEEKINNILNTPRGDKKGD
ncbi:MAG: helix-turn-helix domain-containing protein [Candidatus Omnitrophota bacterium]